MTRLIAAAQKAREQAYAPYSQYRVGAAVLTEEGEVYLGCNVENAVYPATCCAERVAIFKAVSEGRRRFRALAVATSNGGSPCGICRQVMREFAPEMVVYIANANGEVRRTTVAELLPDSFGPEDLGFVTGK
ncbi:MAG: cytidine deaminase [Caldilineae bacterium]|nr:MAG: cytidine deaminase [Caldilineae bacterium]